MEQDSYDEFVIGSTGNAMPTGRRIGVPFGAARCAGTTGIDEKKRDRDRGRCLGGTKCSAEICLPKIKRNLRYDNDLPEIGNLLPIELREMIGSYLADEQQILFEPYFRDYYIFTSKVRVPTISMYNIKTGVLSRSILAESSRYATSAHPKRWNHFQQVNSLWDEDVSEKGIRVSFSPSEIQNLFGFNARLEEPYSIHKIMSAIRQTPEDRDLRWIWVRLSFLALVMIGLFNFELCLVTSILFLSDLVFAAVVSRKSGWMLFKSSLSGLYTAELHLTRLTARILSLVCYPLLFWLVGSQKASAVLAFDFLKFLMLAVLAMDVIMKIEFYFEPQRLTVAMFYPAIREFIERGPKDPADGLVNLDLLHRYTYDVMREGARGPINTMIGAV